MYTPPTFICATCDLPIAERPVFHLGLAFCCAGCAADGPCMCSYDSPVADAAAVGRAVEIIPVAPPRFVRVAPAAAATAAERTLVAAKT